MSDRLNAIEELMNKFSEGPDRYRDVLKLILEELRYLRDQNSHAKNAVEEFARLMPA